jgi:hypothetical protein
MIKSVLEQCQLALSKDRLKRVLGPTWQRRIHRLGRLRWITKWRLLHAHGLSVRHRPLRHLAYVLADPELESWTYDLANEDQLIAAVAAAFDRPIAEIAGYAQEAHTDHELNERLSTRVRWRFDFKRRLPIGNRLAWYLLVRTRKPSLVVETGIYRGLGSLVLLRALERNAADGTPGELMSFDASDASGELADQGHPRWRRVIGLTTEAIRPALEGCRVGMLIQDTPHTEENQMAEYGAALTNADPPLVLVDNSGGWAPTLKTLSEQHGAQYHTVPLVPRNHFLPAAAVIFAIFNPDSGGQIR